MNPTEAFFIGFSVAAIIATALTVWLLPKHEKRPEDKGWVDGYFAANNKKRPAPIRDNKGRFTTKTILTIRNK
jgi:hypothetical protein